MKYISTRGEAPAAGFREVCLAGLAPDGGLYVPERYPQISPAGQAEPYASLAARILTAFAGDALSGAEANRLTGEAYASFAHHAVAPLVQAAPGLWLMELHHGPTLAFKDVAMQLIARLYDHFLAGSAKPLTIICATSGDTGGAAAAAFAGSRRARLVILHPDDRVSPVQRLFMTATGASNILNLALSGDFDDCQSIVKSLFADERLVSEAGLTGVNSINWARIAAQTAYYAAASGAFGHRRLRFVVPSGNLGDALAGYVAWRCGLLPGGFEAVCAVNQNDALVRLFDTGVMTREAALETPSPAMDISVPSNFERLLFDVAGRDAAAVRLTYASYAQSGEAQLQGWRPHLFAAMAGLSAQSVSNTETLSEMERFRAETGWLICPHTAVGTAAARRLARSDAPTLVLATAAAAKFPETVLAATGQDAPLPTRCAHLRERGESFERIAPELGLARSRIAAFAGADSWARTAP